MGIACKKTNIAIPHTVLHTVHVRTFVDWMEWAVMLTFPVLRVATFFLGVG